MPFPSRHLMPFWFKEKRLKIRHLYLMKTLSEYSTLHNAARYLGISQPMASKTLTELEDAMGVQLFDRNGRNLALNLFGQTIVRRACNIMGELDLLREDFNALIDGREGRVSIGAVDGAIINIVSNFIVELKNKFPDIDINIHSATSRELFAKLLGGNIDIMIGHNIDAIDSVRFSYEEIGVETLSIVGRKGHPLSQKDKVTLSETINFPWILQERSTVSRRKVDQVFESFKTSYPCDIINSNSLVVTLSYIAKTDALTALPSILTHTPGVGEQLSIIPVEAALKLCDYGLILPIDRRPSPAVQIAVDILRRSSIW
ncbi:LysR family transcriptional regulator [Gluconobacter oxydans]|uniref:LysR family transcriptional regulator n=2 Tax=Gluconobacter TaxID=441 RepID=UPI001C03EB4D|nr:LysR family transcriptional regulator [Gluconobacter oxydans]